ADAVALNTAKISYTDADAVALNTAKISYTDAAVVAQNTLDAGSAQGTADTAVSDASSAQSTADTAVSDAAAAQSTADGALPLTGGDLTGQLTVTVLGESVVVQQWATGNNRSIQLLSPIPEDDNSPYIYTTSNAVQFKVDNKNSLLIGPNSLSTELIPTSSQDITTKSYVDGVIAVLKNANDGLKDRIVILEGLLNV
ncbi:MAG: hypothetical protein DRP93_05600, partial [Candidatus Neomarinimicrobiota bacterium]